MSAMSDTQNAKVGIEPGAERMFVKSGGELDIESGGAFKIGGTAVTATAAEINAAAGTGVSSTELDLLDGALAGVAVVSKAAVYDAAGKLYRSSASPAAAGTLISDATALTAELNTVTGANGTAGVKLPVAAADEVVVIINTDASNNLLVYPVTGSQINALGASNAFTLTPGQRAEFIGRSATLWYTAAATDTISGLTASAAELNFNDTSLAGTSVASKTLVLGASKNTDILGLPVGGLKVGAAGAEVAVGADAAELNVLDGAVAANSVASKAALLDANKKLQTGANNGAVITGATTVAVEVGDGHHHTTILTLTGFAVGTSGDNAALAIGAALYELPVGAVIFESCHIDVGFTLADAVQTDTPEVGLGSLVGSGANATLGAVGATAEDYFEGTATADVSGTHLVGTKFPLAAGIPTIIAAGGEHTIFLNAADTWADLTAGSALTADGTVILNWRFVA